MLSSVSLNHAAGNSESEVEYCNGKGADNKLQSMITNTEKPVLGFGVVPGI